MAYKIKKEPKIAVIVGLKKEKRVLENFTNLNLGQGYGKNSEKITKTILSKETDVLVSFGFAGSLKENIKNGDIIFPKYIFSADGKKIKTSKKYCDFFISKIKNLKISRQNLITVTEVINNKKDLSKKYKENISALDMESAFIQKEAKKKKIPFVSIRLIFDDLSFSIPEFLINSVNHNGDLIFLRLLKKIIEDPRRILTLIKTGLKYQKSKKSLGKLANQLF